MKVNAADSCKQRIESVCIAIALFVGLISIDFDLIEPVRNGPFQFLSHLLNNKLTATIPLAFVFYTIQLHQVYSFSSSSKMVFCCCVCH